MVGCWHAAHGTCELQARSASLRGRALKRDRTQTDWRPSLALQPPRRDRSPAQFPTSPPCLPLFGGFPCFTMTLLPAPTPAGPPSGTAPETSRSTKSRSTQTRPQFMTRHGRPPPLFMALMSQRIKSSCKMCPCQVSTVVESNPSSAVHHVFLRAPCCA